MSQVPAQVPDRLKPFRLGHLGNLNQVIKALGKTIRGMADGTLDDQKGARICNGLGILRACLETQGLERISERLDQMERATPISSRPPIIDQPRLADRPDPDPEVTLQ